MKSYDEIKAEMEDIQQEIVQSKIGERTHATIKGAKRYKEFGFTVGMGEDVLAAGWKNK